MASKSIPPSPNRSRPPSFTEMDSGQFEEMCCALLDKEPDIDTGNNLYQGLGKKQYGVDIWCDHKDGGIVVASCRCTKNKAHLEISATAEEFLKHWNNHWQGRNVKKFIFCHALTTEMTDEVEAIISNVKEKLEKNNIDYEFWHARTLQEKLRPYQGIVSNYLGKEWIERICGVTQPDISNPPQPRMAEKNALANQFSIFQEKSSQGMKDRIEMVKNNLRRGGQRVLNDAESIVEDMKQGKEKLSSNVQADLLRLEALIRINQNNLEDAERLAGEADHLHQQEEPRLRSLIAFVNKGPQAALEILGEPKTKHGINEKASLLLEQGDAQQALDLLGQPNENEDDPERVRLWVWALLMSGDKRGALQQLERAEERAPEWFSVQMAGGMIRYACAFSQAVKFTPSFFAPQPMPLALIKEDDDSRALLKNAADHFRRLLQKDLNDEDRHTAELWYLACLANSRDEAMQAQKHLGKILLRNRTNAIAILWALSRGYEFKHGQTRKALADILRKPEGNINHVLALVGLALSKNHAETAAKTLNKYQDMFEGDIEQSIFSNWQEMARNRQGDGDQTEAELAALVLQYKDEEPVRAYGTLMELAQAGRWEFVVQYSQFLIEDIATSESVRLAAHAAYRTNNEEKAISIVDNHQSLFSSGQLPLDLRRLRADANAKLGNMPTAITQMEKIAYETRNSTDFLMLAKQQMLIGDRRGAALSIERIEQGGEVAPEIIIPSVAIASKENPALARRLLGRISKGEIPAPLKPSALSFSLQHGNQNLVEYLTPDLPELSQDPDSPIAMLSEKELTQFIQQRQQAQSQFEKMLLQGKIPIHADPSGQRFWKNFLGQDDQPLLVHHGCRQIEQGVPLPIGEWDLCLDITSLMLADRIGLLDVFEDQNIQISLPYSTQIVFMQMEDLLENSSRLKILREKVAYGITKNSYRLLPEDETINRKEWSGIGLCLVELMALPHAENRIIWADDRFITGHAGFGNHGNHLVSVVDVISAMLNHNMISKRDYFNFLLKLRETNAHFIPLMVGEVMHHLQRADINDGIIVETNALRILRKHFSQALLLGKNLDLREDAIRIDGRPNETNFLLGENRLVVEAILHIWKMDNLSLDQKEAQSLWIWHAFRIEWFEHEKINQKDFFPDTLQFLLLIGHLLFCRSDANQNNLEANKNSAKEYLIWLEEHIIDASLKLNPDLVNYLASKLIESFNKIIEDGKKKGYDDGVKFIISEFVLILPIILRNRVLSDQTFSQQIGIDLTPTLSMFGHKFNSYEFWNAVKQACDGANGRVDTDDKNGYLKLTRKESSETLQLSGVQSGDWNNPVFKLLSDDINQRRSFFDEQPKTLDYPPDIRQKRIQEIIEIASPADRIHKWQDIDQDSADNIYQRLGNGIIEARRTGSIDRSLFLPPSISQIDRYLRLDSNIDNGFTSRLENVGESLSQQYGALEAFRRLCGLPTKIPNSVVEALGELKEENLTTAYSELTSKTGSVLRRLHRIYVMCCLRGKKAKISEDKIILSVESLLDDWHKEAGAFIFLLNWSEHKISEQKCWGEASSSLKLASPWLHADHVLSIEAGNQEKYSDWLSRALKNWPGDFSLQNFILNIPHRSSVAYSGKILPQQFLLQGLNYALGEDGDFFLRDTYRNKLLSEFKNFIVNENDIIKPSTLLLSNVFETADDMNSIFSKRPSHFVSYLWGDEVLSQLHSAAREKLIRNALLKIENGSNILNGWLNLSGCFLERIEKDDLVHAIEAIRNINLEDMLKEYERYGIDPVVILLLLSDAAALSRSDRAREVIRSHLLKIAQSTNIKNPLSASLLDVILTLSRSESSKEGLIKFTQILNEIIETNSSLALLYRPVCGHFLSRLPSNLRKILWQSYVRFRTED